MRAIYQLSKYAHNILAFLARSPRTKDWKKLPLQRRELITCICIKYFLVRSSCITNAKNDRWHMLLVSPNRDLVYFAVDLSRLPDNPIAETQLADILEIGREVDTLETIRRSNKGAKIPLDLIRFQATRLRIPPKLFDINVRQQFEEKGMISVVDGKATLLFEVSMEVYNYGLKRLAEIEDEKQIDYLEILAKALKKPILFDDFLGVLTKFDPPYRNGLYDFIIENKILIPFKFKGESYLISHRLYRDEKKLRMALEILEEHHLENVVTFLHNNPGNPLPVVRQYLKIDHITLNLLAKYGLLEPLKLDVHGDSKNYIFSPQSTLSREDKDHLDLVKTTIANFRFGEYYSKKRRLRSLDEFLSSMLDRGFAGWAEPIGTDYQTLEKMGIVNVRRVSGNKYRFWMIKRDVIEDARDIIRGIIPIQSNKDVGNLMDINNLVQTRRQIDVTFAKTTKKAIIEALRQIQEGVCS